MVLLSMMIVNAPMRVTRNTSGAKFQKAKLRRPPPSRRRFYFGMSVSIAYDGGSTPLGRATPEVTGVCPVRSVNVIIRRASNGWCYRTNRWPRGARSPVEPLPEDDVGTESRRATQSRR